VTLLLGGRELTAAVFVGLNRIGLRFSLAEAFLFSWHTGRQLLLSYAHAARPVLHLVCQREGFVQKGEHADVVSRRKALGGLVASAASMEFASNRRSSRPASLSSYKRPTCMHYSHQSSSAAHLADV
jgi:hypothetical protein